MQSSGKYKEQNDMMTQKNQTDKKAGEDLT